MVWCPRLPPLNHGVNDMMRDTNLILSEKQVVDTDTATPDPENFYISDRIIDLQTYRQISAVPFAYFLNVIFHSFKTSDADETYKVHMISSDTVDGDDLKSVLTGSMDDGADLTITADLTVKTPQVRYLPLGIQQSTNLKNDPHRFQRYIRTVLETSGTAPECTWTSFIDQYRLPDAEISRAIVQSGWNVGKILTDSGQLS